MLRTNRLIPFACALLTLATAAGADRAPFSLLDAAPSDALDEQPTPTGAAAGSETDLAEQLQNPVANFGLGGKYYAEGPTGGPERGLRFVVTFLFPKR